MSINFKHIKESITMKDVLEWYGINKFKPDGSYVGRCPIHNGNNPTAFHATGYKWNCFTRCGRGGTVIDFVALKEKVSLYEAAKKLVDWFDLNTVSRKRNNPQQTRNPATNKPLNFRLNLKADHPYLKARKILPETIEYFGIGYCTKGIMKGRIAIPIHNAKGELIAYIGRAVSNSNLKYRFPRGFHKSEVLYNLHKARKEANKNGLIVVEGFFDVFRLHQAGFRNVIAIMGSSLSQKQAQLISQHTSKVILMFDGDEPGKKGMNQAASLLMKNVCVRSIILKAPNYQPDLIKEDNLKRILARV